VPEENIYIRRTRFGSVVIHHVLVSL